MQKDDLDVAMDGTVLTISGHRRMGHIQQEDYIWREREDGRFVRVLRLPTEVVEGKRTASVGNGLLTVHLPKAVPTAVKHKILIEGRYFALRPERCRSRLRVRCTPVWHSPFRDRTPRGRLGGRW